MRVVRSHKEKRSAYAPSEGVRYDGVYRIEKARLTAFSLPAPAAAPTVAAAEPPHGRHTVQCWCKQGVQGKLMCRYLFVRCDNAPAPWSAELTGDKPRPLPDIGEMKGLSDEEVYSTGPEPYWAWDPSAEAWGWARPQPDSSKPAAGATVRFRLPCPCCACSVSVPAEPCLRPDHTRGSPRSVRRMQ